MTMRYRPAATVEDLAKLRYPFRPDEIEWRIQNASIDTQNTEKSWAIAVPYIEARAIMNRLDEVVGPSNWFAKFYPWRNDCQLCHLSILCRVEDPVSPEGFRTEWITKVDGAPGTEYEEIKGGLSAALKRAAVHWGIGRYLYTLDAEFVKPKPPKGPNKGSIRASYKKQRFTFDPPQLPAHCLPGGEQAEAPQQEPQPQPQTQVSQPKGGDDSAGGDSYVEQLKSYLRSNCGCRTKGDASSVVTWVCREVGEEGEDLGPRYTLEEAFTDENKARDVLSVLSRLDDPSQLLDYIKSQGEG